MRLGTISVKEGSRTLSLPTPGCVLYTKSGCVPHLTHDTLRLSIFEEKETEPVANGIVQNENDRLTLPLLFPLAQFIPHCRNLSASTSSLSSPSSSSLSPSSSDGKPRRGILEFSGLSRDFDVISFVVQNDPAAPLPSGFNVGQSVALWNIAGKAEVTPSLAADLTSAIAPHVAQILADSDVGFHQRAAEGSSKKRVAKALKRSQAFADSVARQLEEKSKDIGDGDSFRSETAWWATASASLDIKDFARYVYDLPKNVTNEIGGFIFDGFLPPKDMSVAETVQHIKRVVESLGNNVSALPSQKPRFLPHVSTPHLVVEAVEVGIDLFDTSFAVVASNRGGALVFDCDSFGVEEECDLLASSSSPPCSSPSRFIEMDLNASEYAEDFGPLLSNCACYSCATHTRAYVHHLLVTQELLAHVLLMIHNQFHYLKFFHRLRHAIEDGTWTQFKTLILSHRHVVPQRKKVKIGEEEEEPDGTKKKKKLVL